MSNPMGGGQMNYPPASPSGVNPIVIVICLLFCFPVGLFLVWAKSGWSVRAKWGATAATLLLIISWGAYNNSSTGKRAVEQEQQAEQLAATQREAAMSPSERLAEKSTQATAERVAADYNGNQLAADNKYTDKEVVVTGSIRRVGETDDGTPALIMPSYGDTNGVALGFLFTKNDSQTLANIRQGQVVTVLAKCHGMDQDIIGFDGCSIVDEPGARLGYTVKERGMQVLEGAAAHTTVAIVIPIRRRH